MDSNRSPCVLLVDDDDLVRDALGSGLRRSGFAVLSAAGGEEAISLYRRHGDCVGVVLLDVRMPRMDGTQTLAALRELDPAVKSCFISGYAGGHTREALLALGASHVFAKPFSLEGITRALRELLDAGAA